MHLRPSRSYVSRVIACDHVVVSPQAEQVVPVKLVCECLRIPRADWLLEPGTLAMRIYVGRVLLPDEERCPAVRVSNQTSQPFVLPAGTEFGQASMAHAVDMFSKSGLQQNTASLQSAETVRKQAQSYEVTKTITK